MWRDILRRVLGRRGEDTNVPPSQSAQSPKVSTVPPSQAPQSPEWRAPPTRTLTDNLGDGIVLTTTFATGHHGFIPVVGEGHYQDALRALTDRLGSAGVFSARLVPEPDNAYDANAVRVCVAEDGATVGYLARPIAKTYHASLARHTPPVTCPARLTGAGRAAVGVVLDFEPVREALGLARVSVDHGDIDYEASAEYHRRNQANRQFVKETRSFEKSNPDEAVARYRRAVAVLSECRSFSREKGLEAHGYSLNQTDATPIERLVLCLVKMGKVEDAMKELDHFIESFPHAGDMTLVKASRDRINRARRA
jgi:hypothetical protein